MASVGGIVTLSIVVGAGHLVLPPVEALPRNGTAPPAANSGSREISVTNLSEIPGVAVSITLVANPLSGISQGPVRSVRKNDSLNYELVLPVSPGVLNPPPTLWLSGLNAEGKIDEIILPNVGTDGATYCRFSFPDRWVQIRQVQVRSTDPDGPERAAASAQRVACASGVPTLPFVRVGAEMPGNWALPVTRLDGTPTVLALPPEGLIVFHWQASCPRCVGDSGDYASPIMTVDSDPDSHNPIEQVISALNRAPGLPALLVRFVDPLKEPTTPLAPTATLLGLDACPPTVQARIFELHIPIAKDDPVCALWCSALFGSSGIILPTAIVVDQIGCVRLVGWPAPQRCLGDYLNF